MEEVVKGHKYFATQREGEEVLLIARRHWIVYVPSVLAGLLVVIVSLVLYLSIGSIGMIESNEIIKAIMICAISISMLFTSLFIYVSWIVNFLNFQMVTNMHLVDIDQFGLFSRKISELSLDDIQDVSATQHGIFQSLLHYGEVVVQTAGEKPNFMLEKIKDPYEVSRKIMEIKDRYGQEKAVGVPEEQNPDPVPEQDIA